MLGRLPRKAAVTSTRIWTRLLRKSGLQHRIVGACTWGNGSLSLPHMSRHCGDSALGFYAPKCKASPEDRPCAKSLHWSDHRLNVLVRSTGHVSDIRKCLEPVEPTLVPDAGRSRAVSRNPFNLGISKDSHSRLAGHFLSRGGSGFWRFGLEPWFRLVPVPGPRLRLSPTPLGEV